MDCQHDEIVFHISALLAALVAVMLLFGAM